MSKEIVMIIPSFTPLIGGAERQLLGLLNHLRFKEYSFRVLTRKVAGTKILSVMINIKLIELA